MQPRNTIQGMHTSTEALAQLLLMLQSLFSVCLPPLDHELRDEYLIFRRCSFVGIVAIQ